MNNYDLEKAKVDFNEIKIPDSLNIHISKTIRKVERKKLIIKISSIAASLIFAFIISVNGSQVIADEISKVPGLAPLVNLVRFDKGLKSAIENGYYQNIGMSKEDKDIVFKINNLILDNKKMVIDYSIEGKEQVYLNKFNLSDEKGERLKALIFYSDPNDENKGNKRGTIEVTLVEGEIFPEEIKINFTSLRNGFSEGSKVIEGNWNFQIKLDKKLMEDKGKIINTNKNISIGNYNFQIENVRIYPTITYVKIKLDPNYKFTGFKSPYLIDNKGRRYNLKGWVNLEENIIDMQFESGYFTNIKEIYFKTSGVYIMPLEDKYLEIDLENKKILNSSGYGVELGDIIINNERKEETIELKITDEKILKEKEEKSANSMNFDYKGYDENNKELNYSIGTGLSGGESPIVYLNLPLTENIPKKLKIKITGVYSGNMKDINTRLY